MTKNEKGNKNKETPNPSILLRIGDEAIKRGWKVVRSPLVRAVGGERFYRVFGEGEGKMYDLLESIRKVDPDRFGHLKYIPVRKKKTKHFHLTEEEESIISDTLLEITQLSGGDLPKGASRVVHNRLIEAGFTRSYNSTNYHVRAVWDGKYPVYNGEIPDRVIGSEKRTEISKIVEIKVDETKQTEESKGLEGIVGGSPQEGEEAKKKFMKYAPRGHQELVAYLMDPENYKKILGDNINLLRVDFKEEQTHPDLFEAFKHRLDDLPEIDEDDRDAIDFANGWLRCDITYQRETPTGLNGPYIIAEVKQYAENRKDRNGEMTHNDDKARQQMIAYPAVTEDNIKLRNERIRAGKVQGKLLKESVEAVLFAYKIDSELADHLNVLPGKMAVTVPKEEVRTYIDKILGQSSQTRGNTIESKVDDIQTNEQKEIENSSSSVESTYPIVNVVSNPDVVDISPKVTFGGIAETQREVDETPKKGYVETFETIGRTLSRDSQREVVKGLERRAKKIVGKIEGSAVPVYDPGVGILRYDGKLYKVNGGKNSHRAKVMIRRGNQNGTIVSQYGSISDLEIATHQVMELN